MDKPLKILLIEDNPTDVILLREALAKVRTVRFEVAHAKRLEDGLQWLDAQAFDAVLLDLGLPDSQGMATFEAMHGRHPRVPVIVLSGLDDESLAVKAVGAGAQDYVVKGTFNGNMLALTIRYAIERKRTEAALRESEERYRALSEAAPDDIFIVRRDGTLEYVNNKGAQRFGRPVEELVGKAPDELFPASPANPSDPGLEVVQLGIDKVFQSGEPTYRESHITFPSCEVWQGIWLVPLKHPSGEVHAVMGFGRDISGEKRAEAKLRGSEARYRSLFESNPQPMWVYDVETLGFLEVNDAAVAHYGYSGDEFMAMAMNGLSPGRNNGCAPTPCPSDPVGETAVLHRKKDGTVIEVQLSTHELTFGDRPARLAMAHDVTGRMESDRALQSANDNLERRVMERTSELGLANQLLLTAKEEADTANAAKSEFLSRMSHELRTPLNAILGFGQMLGLEDLNPQEKENVGHILKGGWHLLDLINEVLDITRVESGNLELSLEPIALNDIVPEACALLRPLAAERNIRLEENTSALGHSHILADRLRLKQVLINLLANAIKYNRASGLVQVTCTKNADGWTTIAVRDTGPGIAPEDLPKLFMPFERFGAEASEVEGTGLGLVLSQRLMKAMGGNLDVASTLGKGTTFTIQFPQAVSPEEQLANMLDMSSPVPVLQEVVQSFTVLCIEDNPSNLRLLEVIFQARPEIELLSAMQGSVGLDLARQHHPDLILLDLNLPDINGKEVLARLQESATTQDIPVVVISADATPQQMKRLLAAGAREYLTKPLDVGQVLATLDKILRVALVVAA